MSNHEENKRELKPLSRLGFTLAEILIVVGIIGTIAAITIPTLIKNNQKTQYTTALKKAYTSWSQALQQMASDAGCTGDLSCFFDSSDLSTLGPKIEKYFKTIKTCASVDVSACDPLEDTDFEAYISCIETANTTYSGGCLSNKIAYGIDGSLIADQTGELPLYYSFVTMDGMAYSLWNATAGCSGFRPYSGNSGVGNICVSQLKIDVNGPKKPNTWGRDIFSFFIINEKGPALYPYGGAKYIYWTTYSGCNYGYKGGTNLAGNMCAGRIMEQGWQMNY